MNKDLENLSLAEIEKKIDFMKGYEADIYRLGNQNDIDLFFSQLEKLEELKKLKEEK